MHMRSAVRWLNVVGAPIFFGALEALAGDVAPFTSVLAFEGLAGLLDPFLTVSGMTRIPLLVWLPRV
jgi:hypothetical protein